MSQRILSMTELFRQRLISLGAVIFSRLKLGSVSGENYQILWDDPGILGNIGIPVGRSALSKDGLVKRETAVG